MEIFRIFPKLITEHENVIFPKIYNWAILSFIKVGPNLIILIDTERSNHNYVPNKIYTYQYSRFKFYIYIEKQYLK